MDLKKHVCEVAIKMFNEKSSITLDEDSSDENEMEVDSDSQNMKEESKDLQKTRENEVLKNEKFDNSTLDVSPVTLPVLYQLEETKNLEKSMDNNDEERSTDDTKISEHNCENCNETFNTIAKLKRHILDKHSENTKSFKCEFCNKLFGRPDHVRRHERQVHKKEEIKFSPGLKDQDKDESK